MIVSVQAQDVRTCSHGVFRSLMRKVVSEGNRQYEYSCRSGIMQMADSIASLLNMRSMAGNLMVTDSLEFTADKYKLLGDYHYENSNYDKSSYYFAEKYFQIALSIYTNNSNFDGEKDKAPMIHRELAQLYYKMYQYEKALTYISLAVDAYTDLYNKEIFVEGTPEYAEYLDVQSQQALCLARIGNIQAALNLINKLIEQSHDENAGYYEMLRKKGKIWMLSDKANASDGALPLYKTYLNWRKKDALKRLSSMTSKEREAYWMRMRPFIADCFQLEYTDPAFLYDVTLFSKGLLLQLNRFSGEEKTSAEALRSLQYTYKQIQQKLSSNACAIEFIEYEKRGKQYMGAIVLKGEGNPKWVTVLSPDDFMNDRLGGKANKKRMNSVIGKTKNALYNDSVLYTKIWNEELVKLIGNAKKVYFAPDGYLHQLAIEYMLPLSLAEKSFYRLTSTRRLMEDNRKPLDSALIFGGIRFDKKINNGYCDGNDSLAFSYIRSFRPAFGYLSETLAESDSIRMIRSCVKDTLLVGNKATEQTFRMLASQYSIINLSTHGFWGGSGIPQGTDIYPCSSDETLSQNILALAGANVNLEDISFNTKTLDGLLSARELSEMNLSNVGLAVISACQTGLGYITADGVYGIQRGLKNAGVNCMIVSLWDVDDHATSLLMSSFHKKMKQGMSVHEAFTNARCDLMQMELQETEMKKQSFNPVTLSYSKKKVRGSYNQPQYCNAFIVIDAIE